MKSKIGTFLFSIGTALILGALTLFVYNHLEAERATQASAMLMPQVIEQIQIRQEIAETASTEPTLPYIPGTPEELIDPIVYEMTEVVIDGHAYIGYISFPTLELEFPVMSGWDYDKLKLSPCRYKGTLKENDLVIMAHNYTKFFGKLHWLKNGDEVLFVDMDGILTRYVVVGEDVMTSPEVNNLGQGEADLTLFTCTYGGKDRFAVYCDRAEDDQ